MRFQQEVVCVSYVLDDQLYCVDKLLQYVGEGAVDTSQAFQRERENYILRDCKSSIQGRIQTFREMDEDAAQLASWVNATVDSQFLRLTSVSILEYRPHRI